MINNAQQIQIDRIKLSSFNSFDGEKVANDLIKNEHLWISFVWGRFGGIYDLIELRDLKGGHINADTLIILTTKDKWQELKSLISKWHADEVGYNQGDDTFFGTPPCSIRKSDSYNVYTALGSSLDKDQILVRIWWD